MKKKSDISVAAAALGCLGGKVGGKSRSQAKVDAVRANGAKGGRPKKGPFDSTFHRDGSVTVWDVCVQGWVRTQQPPDRLLSTLSPEEREKVIAHTA